MHPQIAAAIRQRTNEEVERIDQLAIEHLGKPLPDCTPEDMTVLHRQIQEELTLLRHEKDFAEDELHDVLERIEERWKIEGR